MSGRQLRDAQLGLFEVRDYEFLQSCRAAAVAIAKARGQVSINEVREAVTVPANINPSVLGAVFKSKYFKAVGYTEATHKAAHARVVRVYALA